MAKLNTTLHLQDLELSVHLGWTKKERRKKQPIWLTIDIRFSSTPKACETDQLKDTVCYDHLIDSLRKKIGVSSFRLIERLGSEIYRIVKATLPKGALINLSITKHPDIKKLHGGVSFSFGDS